MSMKVDSNVS